MTLERHLERDRPYALALCLKLAGNPDDAEDLYMAACLRAIKGFSRYSQGHPFGAWFGRICSNLWKDTLRTRGRRIRTLPMDDVPGIEESIGKDDACPFDNDVNPAILAALEELPPIYRETVVLSDLDDLEYAEIADVQKVPVGTVRSRLNRGRQMMREKLTAQGINP
jgi:RNA polymerase sigma-70 factor (ECF subfamily)